MRFAVVLAVVVALGAACDLQPGPKKSVVAATPPADLTPAGVPSDGPAPIVAPDDGPGAQRSVDAMQTSDDCVAVADHMAELAIAATDDETTKAQQIQERARTVRRIAETCTRERWSDAKRACFSNSKTSKELAECVPPKPQ